MEERGHLGKKYENESSVTNPDLWNRIESGIQRKKPRRGILWWWGLGGALFLLAGWWTIRPDSTSRQYVSQQEAASRPSEKLVERQSPSPKEGETNQVSTPNPIVEKAQTNAAESQNQVTQVEKEFPRLPEQTDYKTGTKKPNPTASAASFQLTKKKKSRNADRKEAGKPLFAITPKQNLSSAFLDEKQGRKASSKTGEIAAKLIEPSTLPEAEALARPVNEGRRKVDGCDIPKISTGKDEATVKAETVVSTPDLTSEAEQKASQVDEPRANAPDEVVTTNSSDSFQNEKGNKPAESAEIKADTLTKIVAVRLPDTVSTDSSKLDSTRLDLPRKWRLGVSIGGFYTRKYTRLNEDPEQNRVTLASRNNISTDRFAWSASFWIQKQFSQQLSWFASMGLLFIQDQSDFTVRRDSITGYSERIDANGNHFLRPVYDQYDVSILSRNLYLETQVGVLLLHLAGPIGLKIGAGMNTRVWEERKVVKSRNRALENAGKNAGWVPSFHFGLPFGFRINAKNHLQIEPSVSYFFSAVFKPGKGTDTQPMLLGAKVGFIW